MGYKQPFGRIRLVLSSRLLLTRPCSFPPESEWFLAKFEKDGPSLVLDYGLAVGRTALAPTEDDRGTDPVGPQTNRELQTRPFASEVIHETHRSVRKPCGQETMSPMENGESSVTDDLLARTRQGDQEALGRLFNLHRDYLRRLIDTHMEHDLRARLDPSDVIQETQLVVSQRLEDFLQRRPTSFRVWLRSTAMERLIDLRRRHLAEKRSVHREVEFSDASSMALAGNLLVRRPSEDLQRKELTTRVRLAITRMKPSDREILLLRHVEELSNAEAAEVLRIDPAASRKRLGRALIRLTRMLSDQGLQFN